ncbi:MULTISPECIES: MarR family winged helix-turn-helix transcriptional regulator [unclassified Imperialibacter]|uniref:MarR family winged helix-turn-helix transcriptional regulator n=1 Tax=unclassified Imperialibacter TaxID=2629706 RepID=UPI00125AD3C8|nr:MULTISPECIES: MarR family transcriptional regulator [unclassified Imperialibacter]CAD5276286.1 MarR family transcriptional regulator [Imperialibacter sp. 89]CAD5294967.1 MarR family transcriptional regulator [Imperialibacter sp. 75]VVT26697.1 Transcriptional regulator, MarR family [Imperialibacter sp. EC-SDR9]
MQNKYGFLIEVASRQIKQAFQRKLQQSGTGLTVDQWVVLDKLSGGPKSQVQVVEAVYKDPPTVTRILDLLGRKNLVVRQADPNDRRKFSVGLTPLGQAVIAQLKPVVDEYRNQGWQGLTDEDYMHLHRVMTKIVHNFEMESAATLMNLTAISDEKAA